MDVGEPTPTVGRQGRKPSAAAEKREANIAERRRRECDLLRAWFDRQKDKLPIVKPKPTLADVEKFVRERLREYVARR